MAYFENFPKIYYRFQSANTSSPFYRVLTDITLNVRVQKSLIESIGLYDEYDMLDGETPEIIAEKIYGNSGYHWMILIFNQRLHWMQDFPISTNLFFDHVTRTYGKDNQYQIHHYEKAGARSDAPCILRVFGNPEELQPYDLIRMTYQNSDGIEHVIIDGFITSINIETGDVGVMMRTGTLTDGESYDVYRTTQSVFDKITTIVPISFYVNTAIYVPTTNFEHEDQLNEAKRRIKLIPPSLISQVVEQLEDLMKT